MTEREQLDELFARADKIDSGTWALRELIVDGIKMGYEMAVSDVEKEIGHAGLGTVGLTDMRRAIIRGISFSNAHTEA